MVENPSDKPLPSIIVNLAASEYSVEAGTPTELSVFLTNPSSTGDYFKVSLLGIPPAWVSYSGPPAVWLPAGGQDKVIFKVSPVTGGEDIAGSYLARLQVTSQSSPENAKELEIQIKVLGATAFPGTVSLRTELIEYKTIPGAEIKIPLVISNRAPETDSFELSITNIPASWIPVPLPVIQVIGGGEKRIDIIVKVPPQPAIQLGSLPVKISAASKVNPQNKAEAELKLIIAAFESQGRVGVLMGSVQFSTAPGESLTIPVTVLNRGLQPDTFRLGVEGIPTSWISTAAPVVPLAPGERRDISLSIRPSLTPSSQAGRNKFVVTIASQSEPDQVVRVDCILTIAAYSQFSVALEPKEVRAGEPVRVSVKNQGNTPQLFQLMCTSQNDKLAFDYLPPEGARVAGTPVPTPAGGPASTALVHPTDPTVLSIPTGETAAFKFAAHPQPRLIFGGEVIYPYQVSVKSQQKQSPVIQGQVVSRGMIPIWVIPLVLFLCVGVFLVAIILGQQSGAKAGSATQTYLASTLMGTELSQTSAAGTAGAYAATQTFSAELAQAISTTQTAAASTALAGAATQTVEAATAQAIAATQTSASGTLQAVAATETIAALQTSVATQQTPTFTPTSTFTPSQMPTFTPTGTPTQVQIPRFGGVMLFVSDRDGNLEIYTLDDAGHIGRLTNNPAVDMQPAWSPNMQKVAFTTNRDGQNEIYLMNADGTNLVNLTNNAADNQYPTWSTDGQWIAFSTNRDGNYEIYVLNVSTLEARNLTNNPGADTQPNWVKSTTFDPAGELIVFTSNRDGNPEIYRMKTDGTDQVNLTQSPANDSLAKGSPDGSLLVFTTDRDGNQEVYTMRIDGSNPLNISNNPANDFGPCWAPNQAWVGFTSERDGNREIYITKPNSTEVYNVTTNSSQDVISDWR